MKRHSHILHIILFTAVLLQAKMCMANEHAEPGRKLSRRTQKIVSVLGEDSVLMHKYIGRAGKVANEYWDFVRLSHTASTKELLSLLDNGNPAIKTYAAWALADRRYKHADQLLERFLSSGDRVYARDGCLSHHWTIAMEFYYRVCYHNPHERESKNREQQRRERRQRDRFDPIKEKRADHRRRLALEHRLDSVILYFPGCPDEYLLGIAISNNNAAPSHYERIRYLATVEKRGAAIKELDNYSKKTSMEAGSAPDTSGLKGNSVKPLSIFIEEQHMYIDIKQLNRPDTFMLSDKRYLVISFKSYRGASDFSVFGKKTKPELTGHYLDALDTFKSYITAVNPFTLESRLDIIKYFQPIKNGEWIYYNKKGKIIKKTEYTKGVEKVGF
jgi:hypothetical protein